MTISGIYALNKQETSGKINTSEVDIEIQNYRLNDNNEEVECEETTIVSPGDIVSIIPKVSNNGIDCYLRFKAFYIDNNTDFSNYVTGLTSDFNKYGDYYYYKGILKTSEVLKLFDTIKIPNDVETITTNGKIKLEITVEAIQDKNFNPDYTLDDPWKGEEPTETINEQYDIDDENSNIYVTCENDIEKDILVSSDFFEDAKNLLPGDEFIDTIEINNTDKKEVEYFLRLDTDKNSDIESELLKQIKLIITNEEGQEIYNGSLYIKDKISLGKYKKGEKDKLYFNVIVPTKLDNRFENLNPKISLIFSAEYDSKNPGTGDYIDLATTIFLLSSIGFITIKVIYYKERKKC